MPQLNEIKRGKEIGYKSQRNDKYIWSACVDCRKERWVKLISNKLRSERCLGCGVKMGWDNYPNRFQGSLNPNWAGGKRKVNGYVYVLLFPGDPLYLMATKAGYVIEHRLVMAKHLNRCLLPWEIVHHKNGIKDDNRLENLELITDKRFHLVDMQTKAYIKRLEQRITFLEAQPLGIPS